jgi:hypothetical protein
MVVFFFLHLLFAEPPAVMDILSPLLDAWVGNGTSHGLSSKKTRTVTANNIIHKNDNDKNRSLVRLLGCYWYYYCSFANPRQSIHKIPLTIRRFDKDRATRLFHSGGTQKWWTNSGTFF